MARARGAVRTGPAARFAAAMRADRDAGTAAAIVVLAVVFGIVPHWFAGTGFIERGGNGRSLLDLVTHDARWTPAVATTIAGPLWYWWWRRSAMSRGGSIGIAISLAAAAGVMLCVATADFVDGPASIALRGTYPLLVFANLMTAAAFVIAPRPGDPVPRNRRQAANDATPAARRRERHATTATILAWLSVLFGVLPHWFLGTAFIERGFYGHSLEYLVSHDVGWAIAVATTLAGPAWFWWWRRSATAYGAAIGTAISLASAASVTLCVATADHLDEVAALGPVGTYPALMLAGVMSAAAFLIAPRPADPEALNTLQVRSLVRRSRRPAEEKRPPAPMSPERRRERLALMMSMLVGAATAICIAPVWLLVDGFVEVGGYSFSFGHLMVRDSTWAVAGGATTLAPACYWAWRRWRVPAGRWIGAAVAATGVTATVLGVAAGTVPVYAPYSWWYRPSGTSIQGGSYGLLFAGGIVHVFAFLFAPRPEAGASRHRCARGATSPAAAYWLASGAVFLLVAMAYSEAGLVVPCRSWSCWPYSDPGTLIDLVKTDAAWAAGIGALAFAPIHLFVWQRTALSFGRVSGVALCAAAGLGLWAKLVDAYVDDAQWVHGPAWLVVLVAAALVAAFAVAPEPRDSHAPDAAEVSRLVRRHRATFAKR